MTAKLLLASALAGALLAPPASAQTPAASPPPYSGHGAGSITPELVAKYVAPPLAPAISSHLQALLDLRAPGMGQPTPGAKRLFFGWDITGVGQVWRLDGPDRFPVQMTGGEDATTVRDVTPDGRWVVVQRDRKGEENPGVYLLPADGGALVEVQQKKGVQTFAQFVTDDGQWLYFSSNDVKPDSYALYRWNTASHARETVLDEPGLWDIADHDARGLLLSKSTGSVWSEWSILDPSGKRTPLFGQGEKQEYVARLGAGDDVLVLTPKLGEFRRLYRFKGGRLEPVTPEMKWDVEGFEVDPTRRRIVYTVNEGGYTRLHAIDARTFKDLPLPTFEGADHVTAGAFTRDGRFMTIGVESTRTPRQSYVLDWETGQKTQWVVPSAPEVDTRAFATPQLVTYPARDGTPIPAFVRRPARCEGGPCPVIVMFHGGPEGQAKPSFSTYRQAFVDEGYVLVEPNVRGSDGYGKTWFNADNGAKRLQILTDIEDAARWARKEFAQGGQEPKVGILGGSYGGYSSLIGMTMFAGAYDAGVSIVGIGNFITFLENTAPYRRLLRTTEYGDPQTDREVLVKLSPITYIDRVKAPLMLIQGVSDPRVPVGEALQMHDALIARGLSSPLILFPDEGHGAAKRDNKVQELGHTLAFFDRSLKGQ